MYKRIRFALLLATSLFAVSANGEPMAYSVNSDSWDPDFITDDSLYSIDLGVSLSDERVGRLMLGDQTRIDTEGLAFAPDGTLWGLDDDSSTLFSIDTNSGIVDNNIKLIGFPQPTLNQGNDFGMTFGCDSTPYVTSVFSKKLYKLNLVSGIGEPIGDLNADIIALAAIGSNPTRLFGLGDGQSPNLYSISVTTGAAIKIGGGLINASQYNEGGLSFDSDGNLWAITDRRTFGDEASEILRIDVDTGIATVVGTTKEIGFESLAIGGPPVGCSTNFGAGDETDDETPRIPTLNPAGRLLAIFVLMFAGMVFLSKRIS